MNLTGNGPNEAAISGAITVVAATFGLPNATKRTSGPATAAAPFTRRRGVSAEMTQDGDAKSLEISLREILRQDPL